MKNPDTYFLSNNNLPFSDYFHFGLSTECVIFGYKNNALRVLLIQRGSEPYKDSWAIPGDLVFPEEDVDHTARRILHHLVGEEQTFLEQFYTFGNTGRHPVGRVVTVGYYSVVNTDTYVPVETKWAKQVKWYDVLDLPKLAFDHDKIIAKALRHIRKKVDTEPIGFQFLPTKFTLLDLQGVYEALLNQKFDKPNFRKKMLSLNLITPLNELETNVSHRPAKLYTYNTQSHERNRQDEIDCETE